MVYKTISVTLTRFGNVMGYVSSFHSDTEKTKTITEV